MTQEDILRRAILNDEFPDSDKFFKSDSMAQMVPDRLKFERNAALGAWMSRASGREVNASAVDWQANKDALVRGFFKDSAASNVSDEQLHSLVKTHIQTSEEAADMAANMALQGKTSFEALKEMNAKRGPSLVRGIWDNYTKDLVQRHSVLSQKLAPYRGIVDSAASKMSKEMEWSLPTTQKFQEVATQLLQVPEEDRNLVISAIGATGGATAEERASYLSKLAGAMGRMTETLGASSVGTMEQIGTTFEQLSQIPESIASALSGGVTMQGELASSKERSDAMLKAKENQQAFDILTQQIRQVADSEISPIKGDNWFSQIGIDVARMAPQVAVTVANPMLGTAANLSYFRNTVAAESKSEDPSLTYQQADTIGALTAPFNAAVETFTTLIPFGKVKLPFLQKWLSTATTSVKGTARNFVIRGAASVGAEVAEEMAQAIAPLWTQDILGALSKDMPGVDWEKRMPDFSKIAAQTWGPALVFSIVGGGGASISDIKQGRALASDRDTMVATGMAPAMADQIATAAESGDWSKADTLFRQEFVSTTKATDEEKTAAVARIIETQKAQDGFRSNSERGADELERAQTIEKAMESLTRTRVFRDAEGWAIENTETNDVVRVSSREEAASLAYSRLDDNAREEAQAMAKVLEAYSSGADILELDLGKTMDLSDTGNSEAAMKEAAITEGMLNGMTREQAEKVTWTVLGSNQLETVEGVRRVVSKLFRGAGVMDAIEEPIEGKFQAGLEQGVFTSDEAMSFVKIAAEAMRAPELVTTAESSARGLIEAVSDIVMADTFGQRKDGRKGVAGAVTAGLKARLRRQAELSGAESKFAAFLAAFRRFFKQVFQRSRALLKARKEGKLSGDFDEFLDTLMNVDPQRRHDAAAAKEAMEIAQAGNMAFSLAPRTAQDAEYLAAVERGDMAKAQAIVDEAANDADLEEWFHGNTKSFGGFSSTELGVHLGTEESAQDRLNQTGQTSGVVNKYYVDINNPVILKYDPDTWQALDVWNSLPDDVKNKVEDSYEYVIQDLELGELKTELQKLGFDGIKYPNAFEGIGDSILVFEDSQIKSADPVVYANGKPVPPSQRFQTETPDIRFSLAPDYGIDHRPRDDGPRAFNLAEDDMMPADVYDHPEWYSAMEPQVIRETMAQIRKVKGNPKGKLTIYRAGPKPEFNEGDWVSLSKFYARSHAMSQAPGEYKVWAADVVAEDVRWSMDDLSEFGYFGDKVEAKDTGTRFSLAPRSLPEVADTILAAQMKRPAFFEAFVVLARRKMEKLWKQSNMRARPSYVDQSAEIQSEIEAARVDYEADVAQLRQDRDFELAGARQEKSGKLTQEQIRRDFDGRIAQRQKEWTRQKSELDARLAANDAAIDKDAVRMEKDRQMMALRTLDAILSAFPPEIRAKVGGFVKLASFSTDASREAEITRRLEKLGEVIEDEAKKHYAAKIGKMLDRYKSQKDNSGRISGKLISTATEQVDYAALIADMDVAAQAEKGDALESLIEKSDDSDVVQDALNKLGILRMFETMDLKDSLALESASDWLENTIAEGKIGKKIVDEARKEFLDEMRQEAQTQVLDGKALNIDDANNLTNVNRGTMLAMAQRMRGMLSEALWTTVQRLEIIFGEGSKAVEYFAGQVVAAANKSNDIKRAVSKQQREILSVIFGGESKFTHAKGIAKLQTPRKSGVMIRRPVTKDVTLDMETLTKLADGTITPEVAGIREDELQTAMDEWAASDRKRSVTITQVVNVGEETDRYMSELQGIQWRLWWNQADSKKQMERDGWSDESIKQLDSFLSDESKALGMWISDSYGEAAKMIDPVYRRLFNAPLPRIKGYAPIYRMTLSTSADVMDLGNSDMDSGLAAGFTKSRVNTTAPLLEIDALAAFLSHWENVSHWVSHAELMRDMKAILLDKNVSTSIRQKKGDGALSRLKKDISSIETNGSNAANEIASISKGWSWLMQYRAFKALSFRVSPIAKQTAAALNPLLADVPAHNYAAGLSRALTSPQEFAADVAAMWKSDIVQRRIDGGFSAEARIAQQGASMTGSQSIVLMQAGMLPMAHVDAGWTAMGAAVAFDYYKRSYMAQNNGATQEAAEAHATARLERMIATSAQPSDIVNRSLIERSGNIFARSMSMFVSEQRKALAIEVLAIRKLATGKSKNKALDVQRILVAHFVQSAITQSVAMFLASTLGDDEDEDREWSVKQWALSLSLGPISGLFLVGRGIDSIARRALGLRIFPNNDLAGKAADDLIRGTKSMDELFSSDPEDVMTSMDALSTAVGSVGSAFFSPSAGVVDVSANLVREGIKITKALTEEE